MKVKELIKELNKYNKNMEVYFENYDYEFSISRVELGEVYDTNAKLKKKVVKIIE